MCTHKHTNIYNIYNFGNESYSMLSQITNAMKSHLNQKPTLCVSSENKHKLCCDNNNGCNKKTQRELRDNVSWLRRTLLLPLNRWKTLDTRRATEAATKSKSCWRWMGPAGPLEKVWVRVRVCKWLVLLCGRAVF